MSRNITLNITKRLGLRGLIKRGGEKWKTDDIKAFQHDISKLNKQFFRLANMNEMRRDTNMNQCMLALLHLYGPILWPDPDPSKENDRGWLYKAPCNDAPDYTIDLIFSIHRDIIEPEFISLLITKCTVYKGNRDKNGALLNSASYRATGNHSVTRQNRRNRASSVSSELTEFYTDNEDDTDSVLGETDADHVGEAYTDFDPDTYHVKTRSKAVAPGKAVEDGQGEGHPTLFMVFKLPSDRLRAIAAGYPTLPCTALSSSSTFDQPATIDRKRRFSTNVEQRISQHKKTRRSVAAHTPTQASNPSETRRKYVPGGSGGGGRYVEVPLLEGTEDSGTTSVLASAEVRNRVATESRSGSTLPAQNLLQTDTMVVAPGQTAMSEAGTPSCLHPVQNAHVANEQSISPHISADQYLLQSSTADQHASSRFSVTEQGSSLGSSTRLPGNMLAAVRPLPHQNQHFTYSPFPEIDVAQQFQDTPFLSAMRRQQGDYKITPDDDDDMVITGVQKVEHPSFNWRAESRISQRPSINFGMFTPNSSRRHSTVKEHNGPHQSVPKPKTSVNMSSGRHSTRVETPGSEGPQAPQSELQKKLSRTMLRISSRLDRSSEVHKSAAFKHCATVDQVRQELEKYVLQCIGPENMQQAEDLSIVLYQIDKTRNEIEKRKYRFSLQEIEDGWDMVETGLLELDLGDGEQFRLTVIVLMEGED